MAYGSNGKNTKTCQLLGLNSLPSLSELEYWRTCFVLELRKKSGEEFPPKLSPSHLSWYNVTPTNEWAAFDWPFVDSDFAKFKISLDAEMKMLRSKGTGSNTKQADVLTVEEEEL